MLTRIWPLCLPATLEQNHCANAIGGPGGGHIGSGVDTSYLTGELGARVKALSNGVEESHSVGENSMQGA